MKSVFFIELLIIPSFLFAQLSPGKLTSSHAKFEGTLNCTLCHDLGKKVSNSKCLDCHKEIKNRLIAKKGFHSSQEVISKDCFECHSEHHGRDFEMIRFDEQNFDHKKTGYELTGAHLKIDCRDCHKQEFIQNIEIRQITDTYLGLSLNCIDCHEDYHQNTLDKNCASCHSTASFSPAQFFDHDETEFKLVGKHSTVDCIECHKEETKNGKPFQIFSNVSFSDCKSCHSDVHLNQLKGTCKSCHNEFGFDNHTSLNRYNHNLTNFPLTGSHLKINCKDCHNLTLPPEKIFQEELGIGQNDCNKCHDDVHKGKFGLNCSDCHNVNSFTGNFNSNSFNHNLTEFKLEGKHQDVSCLECHGENTLQKLDFNNCYDCHEDFHQGIFISNNQIRDCSSCHTTDGFEIINYTLEQHNEESNFPLSGSHLATPCLMCHQNNSKEDELWEFRSIGMNCIDCHVNIHELEIRPEIYPNNDCKVCHSTESWRECNFNHTTTQFELLGKHLTIDCRECHWEELTQARIFNGIGSNCIDCHSDVHSGQFIDQKCNSCHGFEDWTASEFSHDRANFILDGSHINLNCEQCHFPETKDGNTYILYKTNQTKCIDCHN